MTGLDIAELGDFEPPAYFCEKCLALFKSIYTGFNTNTYNQQHYEHPTCPVCKVSYAGTEIQDLYEYFDNNSLRLWKHEWMSTDAEWGNFLNHCAQLGRFGARLREESSHIPIYLLFRLFQQAQKCIHFTTYGSISHLFLGALMMIPGKVKVRGVISNIDNEGQKQLRDLLKEATIGNFEFVMYGNEHNVPHQKVIVIDGLIALKGSVNFTLNGWRKVAVGREVLDVSTNIDEVIGIHNRYFSPIWAENSNIGSIINTIPM